MYLLTIEKKIGKFKDCSREIIQNETERSTTNKTEYSVKVYWTKIKWSNMCIAGVPRKERKNEVEEIVKEMMSKKFSKISERYWRS